MPAVSKRACVDVSEPYIERDKHGNQWTITFKPLPVIRASEKMMKRIAQGGFLDSPLLRIRKLIPSEIISDERGQIEFTHLICVVDVEISFECERGWVCCSYVANSLSIDDKRYRVISATKDYRNDEFKLAPGMPSSSMDWADLTAVIRFVKAE